MPKVAIDERREALTWESEVWLAWKIWRVENATSLEGSQHAL